MSHRTSTAPAVVVPGEHAPAPHGAAHAPHAGTASTPGAAPAGPPARPHGYVQDKGAYLKRLKRIEGQVRGIARMVDDDVYCIDILTQVAAVTKALHAVSVGLVGDHLGHCVVDAAKESDEAGAAKVAEATEAIGRLLR